MTLALTPAAVCQCFTLVSLCTSIADPNWIQVQNTSDPSKQLIYGVAFTLHAYQNHTDTGPLGGLSGWGMWLLYILAALCYSAVLFSSFCFLLDFLGAAVNHSKLVTSLHISTALNCLAVLGVCVTCLCVIQHNLQHGRLGSLLDRRESPSVRQKNELQMSPGESLYIEVLGLVFSLLACAFALKGRPEPIPPCLSVEGGDSDTEPLIGGAEQGE
ncbi:transmembrane protein 127 [Xyrauchen texanus]|uniref:transmembrane protein 127 n=1 Tax=Xyrauchen texanus TaxID=154827 RepID=UPI0022423773|nr:transmembrane protein 127 [Xyrauchen texanus]